MARPSAPPIMNAVLTTPEARPDCSGRDAAHRGEQQRVERDAGAEADRRRAGEDVDAQLPSTGARAKSRSPTAISASPVDQRRLDAEAHDEPVGEQERDAPQITVDGR